MPSISIISPVVVLTRSILVTRIAMVVPAHTGLPRQAVKFRVCLVFTGVGFTANEAGKWEDALNVDEIGDPIGD